MLWNMKAAGLVHTIFTVTSERVVGSPTMVNVVTLEIFMSLYNLRPPGRNTIVVLEVMRGPVHCAYSERVRQGSDRHGVSRVGWTK